MSLASVADQGDNLELLKALRQKLATAIDESKSGRDIAALSRQLQIVAAQIESIEETRQDKASNVLDEIVQRHKDQSVRNNRGRILDNSRGEDN